MIVDDLTAAWQVLDLAEAAHRRAEALVGQLPAIEPTWGTPAWRQAQDAFQCFADTQRLVARARHLLTELEEASS